MREKEPKTLHHFFYFLQNGVKLTDQYVLYLSPRLDISSDSYLNTFAAGYLTLRLLMSYIYGAPILDVSRSHTTTQHSR